MWIFGLPGKLSGTAWLGKARGQAKAEVVGEARRKMVADAGFAAREDE